MALSANTDINSVTLTSSIEPFVEVPDITNGIVAAGWATAQQYASTSSIEAYGFLRALNTQISSLTRLDPIDDSIGPPTTTLHTWSSGAVGSATEPGSFAFEKPSSPSAAIEALDGRIAAIVPLAAADEPDSFDVSPYEPEYPEVPEGLTDTPPVVIGGVEQLDALPDYYAPDVTLPSVPAIDSISVPARSLLSLPAFTPIGVDYPSGVADTFSFAETEYTTSLLTQLKATLQSWVTGTATGIDATVEQAIWSRSRARDILAAGRKAQEALRQFASRGFSKPPGALAVALLDAEQEVVNAGLTNSRDVAIKQAELEQSNRRFAFEQAWKVEEGLITFSNSVAQRAYEAAKTAQQIGIDIYQRVTERYAADVQAHTIAIEKWKASIQFELAKLEQDRQALEVQRLIGQVNTTKLEQYRAQVEGLRARVDVFRAQVESRNTIAATNKAKIEAYASSVGAYAEKVRAKASEYDGYATRVKAEATRVDAFGSEVQAYRAKIDAYRAREEARASVKASEIRVNGELPVELVKARTTMFESQVRAEAERMKSLSEQFNVRLREVEVRGGLEGERTRSVAAAYAAESSLLRDTASLRVEAAKANIQAITQQNSLILESLRAGAQISAQLAASALSAVNFSGGLSASSQNSSSRSTQSSTNLSQQLGYSASANYNYTP